MLHNAAPPTPTLEPPTVTLLPPPTAAPRVTLRAVDMLSATEGWAIGRDELGQGFLLRYTTP